MGVLTSEVDLESCSDTQSCFDSCSSRSSSRSHSRPHSRSSRFSDCSTCRTCNKRRKRHPPDRFKFLKGGGPDSRCSSGSPSPLAKPCLKLPGGGDVKDSHHGSTRTSCSSSCSSSRYVTPSDSPQPLEYQPCPRQLTAIGWRLNWTLMEAKLDSPVAVPVAAASTVTGCKDRAAGRTDRSRTPTVRHIPMVRQLFEVVPRKGDPAVLCRWYRRHLELNVTQKVARKRWRIAVLMISIIRWLLPERLKGGGTTSSTSTSASTTTTTTTTTTQFNTSTTSQAKKGSKITRKTASVPAFCPQGAKPPSPSRAPCQSPGLEGKPKSIMMYTQGARIPFICQEVREKLESHVCRKQSQRLWGFPKLVTRYVGDLALQQLPTSGSAGDGKIMGNVTDRQAVFSGRAHRNTEFRLKNKTTRPAEEPQATAAVAKDSSSATRPVEKTTTSTVLQPAESHATKPSQTRHSLNQTSPVRSLTPERCWLEKKVRSKYMEVKLKHFPGMVSQSYQSALASATSHPTRKPTQVAEAPAVVLKRTAPLRQRDKVLFMNQEELRHLEDNLIMKHMEHLQRQGVTTASVPSAHTQRVTTASAPSAHTQRVTTASAPSAHTQRVTTASAPSAHTQRVTTASAPSAHTQRVTTASVPSAHTQRVTTASAPSAHTQRVTTASAHTQRVTTASVPSAHTQRVTTASAPSAHTQRVTTASAHTQRVTTASAPSAHTQRVTTASAPSQRVTTASVPSAHTQRVTTASASSAHTQRVTTASAPSAHTQRVTTASAHTQRVTTASAHAQISHSLALETSTHTATVSHPHPALIKELVLMNGLEGGFGELKTLLAPQQHEVKPSSATAKVVSGPADSAVSSNTETQRSSGLPLPPLIRPPSRFNSAHFT
ncbi:flocculation protein FLO11 isoform X2 [Salmo trutta]|nr:flocculation protein FLO11-like isoform X2 [Salmo trutta]XP_029589835.1 flocculation protein FLO11-like isoform X2 [Salmo trutta]XP_029589836.1 flocculation protein FLO11-like isoform X2 [Salmo trutta]